MKKVLFMDVDGVLTSMRTVYALGRYPHSLDDVWMFDQNAISLIRRFCSNARVDIVMSSSWRTWNTMSACRAALGLPIMDKTPHIKGVARGDEIEAYLQAHTDITGYAILDDGNDMLDYQLPHFIRTDTREGFCFKDYCRLCEMFGLNPFMENVGEIPDHFSFIDRELWRSK